MKHVAGKTKYVFEIVLFFVLCAVLVLVFRDKEFPFQNARTTLAELNDGWYYIEDGERVDVTLPAEISVENGSALTLYYDSLDANLAGLTLLTKGAQYDLTIVAGDETIYNYDDTEFARNEQMEEKLNCETQLPRDCVGESLVMSFSGAKDGVYEVSTVYITNSDTLFRYYLHEDALSLIIIFAMAILAVLCIWLFLYLAFRRQADLRVLHIAIFLLLCGVWCATDSSLIQHIESNDVFNTYLSFYTFMLLALPIIFFVRRTKNMSSHKSIDIALYATYANVIGQSLAHCFGGVDYIDMLTITHVVLVGSILTMLIAMFREYRKSRSGELLSIFGAFWALAIAGGVAIFLYWALHFLYYELLFEVGILIFILILMWSLVSSMMTNMQYRTEMLVYQKLSMEDKLTGLRNRRSFDTFLEDLTVAEECGQNPVMIYMDLNYLKETNDRYGHNAGDQLLVAAAGCIKTAYGGAGECFRIGGDEFCAVLPNTRQTAKELSARLDEAIVDASISLPFAISIARGISFLITPEEGRKSFEDWQKEADREMYRDKQWRKQQEGRM